MLPLDYPTATMKGGVMKYNFRYWEKLFTFDLDLT
jgi:hypothetical protein